MITRAGSRRRSSCVPVQSFATGRPGDFAAAISEWHRAGACLLSLQASEWVARCSARLHAQWPRVLREQRDEVAAEIQRDSRWQACEPECAAVEWLSQGIPVEGRNDVDRPAG